MPQYDDGDDEAVDKTDDFDVHSVRKSATDDRFHRNDYSDDNRDDDLAPNHSKQEDQGQGESRQSNYRREDSHRSDFNADSFRKGQSAGNYKPSDDTRNLDDGRAYEDVNGPSNSDQRHVRRSSSSQDSQQDRKPFNNDYSESDDRQEFSDEVDDLNTSVDEDVFIPPQDFYQRTNDIYRPDENNSIKSVPMTKSSQLQSLSVYCPTIITFS